MNSALFLQEVVSDSCAIEFRKGVSDGTGVLVGYVSTREAGSSKNIGWVGSGDGVGVAK
jgi:hypothetical protein